MSQGSLSVVRSLLMSSVSRQSVEESLTISLLSALLSDARLVANLTQLKTAKDADCWSLYAQDCRAREPRKIERDLLESFRLQN